MFYQSPLPARTVDASESSCGISPDRRIMWQGVPAIDSRCTLYIPQPEVRDSGNWTCQLITAANQLAEATFDVIVYTPTEVAFGARPYR